MANGQRAASAGAARELADHHGGLLRQPAPSPEAWLGARYPADPPLRGGAAGGSAGGSLSAGGAGGAAAGGGRDAFSLMRSMVAPPALRRGATRNQLHYGSPSLPVAGGAATGGEAAGAAAGGAAAGCGACAGCAQPAQLAQPAPPAQSPILPATQLVLAVIAACRRSARSPSSTAASHLHSAFVRADSQASRLQCRLGFANPVSGQQGGCGIECGGQVDQGKRDWRSTGDPEWGLKSTATAAPSTDCLLSSPPEGRGGRATTREPMRLEARPGDGCHCPRRTCAEQVCLSSIRYR